jgi:hypothetical protein
MSGISPNCGSVPVRVPGMLGGAFVDDAGNGMCNKGFLEQLEPGRSAVLISPTDTVEDASTNCPNPGGSRTSFGWFISDPRSRACSSRQWFLLFSYDYNARTNASSAPDAGDQKFLCAMEVFLFGPLNLSPPPGQIGQTLLGGFAVNDDMIPLSVDKVPTFIAAQDDICTPNPRDRLC